MNSNHMLKQQPKESFLIKIAALAFVVIAVCGMGFANANSSASAEPFHIGLLPHLSHKMLLKIYRPIIKHVENNLGRKVKISSAPNFAIYIQRAEQGQYDLYHTAPHMAAYAIAQSKYYRLAKFDRELHGLILVSADSSYDSIEDLHGKLITAPDSLAVITLLGELTLQNHGLTIGEDVTVKYTPTHNNAMLAVTKGFADAAIAGISAYKKMKPEIRAQLRVVKMTPVIPHMMFLANSQMPEREVQQLRQILLEFNAEGAGKQFFSDTVFGDMTPITDQDLKRLEPMLSILQSKI